jgi:AcrR family transcriptional regulator
MGAPRSRTDERILEAALSLFASRGYEATSLDAIAADLGITKQTILYWFPSKEALLGAVVERSAAELAEAIEASVAGVGPGMERVEAVLRTTFRFAVRRPAVLGLLQELNRLGPPFVDALAARLRPFATRAAAMLRAEMDAGTIRRADPDVLLALLYATVVGTATGLEAQRALGLASGPAALRRLRRELLAYVGAALRP